ncbi:MAG TPA: phosphatidylinositol mannoside acyltransferase [Acidimicrobiales bacterium]|nr:phosphatidylinositol mannoside acyltransferase [Acidimicrobiales bacterium]
MRRRATDRATYLAYRAGAAAARGLPGGITDPAAQGIGRLLLRQLPGRRNMLRRHLSRVLGAGATPEELDALVRDGFESYARYWLESFRLPGRSKAVMDAQMKHEGFELILEARAAGNGAIMALPHLGGWDFGGAWLAAQGHPMTVVVERLDPPELFEWFRQLRADMGMNVIAVDDNSGAAVLRALKQNHVVALVSDRDLTGTGPEVEFFGERTTLPGGPAVLALRTGAPILPVGVYFRPDGGYHGIVHERVPVERVGPRLADDVARITQLLAYELETLIRRAPEQWHLLQPNWPSDTAGVAG